MSEVRAAEQTDARVARHLRPDSLLFGTTVRLLGVFQLREVPAVLIEELGPYS